MRLCRDTSLAARSVYVYCIACDKCVRLSDTYADTEGTKFLDYYCIPCSISASAASPTPVPRYIDGRLLPNPP